MSDPRAPFPDRVIAEAAAWDARLRLPGSGAKEREAFVDWCDADPLNRAAFDELQAALSGLAAAAASSPELRAIRDAALGAADRGWRWHRLAAAAAVLLVMAGALWLVLAQRPAGTAAPADEPVIARNAPGPAQRLYATAVGERSTVTLEDGSRVTLNTASRIAVAFGANGRREVALLAGQALFEVAHDPARPFVVRAGDKTVTALGTVFDVRLDQRRGVQVTLIDGRVAVAALRPAGAAPLPLAELLPGQRFLAAAEAPAQVLTVDAERETSWRDGRVFFDDQPLGDAVAEMNRYSPIALVVDPDIAGIRINGMFRAGQQASFARTLEAYLPVEIERQDADRILLKRRE